MSTLGDLLAEHTVLPGNAVDHLHAVVGEWQLLADLSFADYLMWVRRDDGVLVCVAQCRPNTAPTVLLADAVGTTAGADEMPLVTAAFKSGAIGQESVGGQQDSQEDGGLNVEAVPVRYDNHVVAVLTHQTASGGPTEGQSAGKRLPGLRGRPAAHAVAKARSPMWATWRCRGPAPASATASSGWTSPASSSSPAPTRCRPITGWVWPPNWRGTTWSP